MIQPSRNRPSRPTLFDDQGEVVELASAWLRSLVESPRNYSPKSIELYGNNLKYFCEYLRSSELHSRIPIDVLLTSISTLGLEKYFKSLQNDGFADSTVRNREVSLKEFFVWLTTAQAGHIRTESGWSRRYMTRRPRRKMPRFITKISLSNWPAHSIMSHRGVFCTSCTRRGEGFGSTSNHEARYRPITML